MPREVAVAISATRQSTFIGAMTSLRIGIQGRHSAHEHYLGTLRERTAKGATGTPSGRQTIHGLAQHTADVRKLLN